MKKLFIFILGLCLFIFPYHLKAEINGLNLEESLKDANIEPVFKKYNENDKQVIVYFFRGKDESKSNAFLNYLNGIYEEYGKYFKLKSYEIFENADNKKLMDNVIDYLSANINDAPFIVVGDTYFATYDDSINENFLNTIVSEYNNEKRVDKVEEVLVRYYRNYDLMIGLVITLVVVFIGLMVFAILQDNKKDLND